MLLAFCNIRAGGAALSAVHAATGHIADEAGKVSQRLLRPIFLLSPKYLSSQQFGLSCRWSFGQNRAAMRQSAAVWPEITLKIQVGLLHD